VRDVFGHGSRDLRKRRAHTDAVPQCAVAPVSEAREGKAAAPAHSRHAACPL